MIPLANGPVSVVKATHACKNIYTTQGFLVYKIK